MPVTAGRREQTRFAPPAVVLWTAAKGNTQRVIAVNDVTLPSGTV